jgi:hypothetical protein
MKPSITPSSPGSYPGAGFPPNGNGNGHAASGASWPGDLVPRIPQADASSPHILSTSSGCAAISLPGDADRPVFVLTVARSGSTLLRFILDSHPELACPPETSIGPACLGIARLWDILDPSPESAARDFAPDQVPTAMAPDAAASIRRVIAEVYGRYLARHGKRRWCDKSLDSARMADLLAQLYPAAQFICLYRHGMDVVVSALDAAPWGLSGYGFDAYVASTPGNHVLAAARCWQDQTTAITGFQARHPDRCHGVRYEDLVTRPEEVAADLFAFLGVAEAPGITETCLTQDREPRGPGDHKIWFTSRISANSLGQGRKAPAGMLPPEFLAKFNATLEQLAYRQVDDAWQAAPGPLDPRADADAGGMAGGPLDSGTAELEEAAAEMSGRLVTIPGQRASDLAARWPEAARRTLCLAVEPPAPGTGARRCWALSYDEDGELAVRRAEQPPAGAATLSASAHTWLALFGGTANFATELRAGSIRHLGSPAGDSGQGAGFAVTQLLAHLAGLAGTARTQVTTGKEG